jgi:hypothetical protein
MCVVKKQEPEAGVYWLRHCGMVWGFDIGISDQSDKSKPGILQHAHDVFTGEWSDCWCIEAENFPARSPRLVRVSERYQRLTERNSIRLEKNVSGSAARSVGKYDA